ncbi:MAG TPA: thiamine pyrophosphate-dependent enzyme [Anaeromyxobacteraceae bacterium]|jgi:pyruvate dehydrogenase E1 component alpha subunit/2-oxoisovalerate dehydrogenase E1 component alpha subunit|nr:thiamine pyrophosphate-dependent enzyme [Anaeromyxobacteraceae bacterium]
MAEPAPDLALFRVLDEEGRAVGALPEIAPEKLLHLHRHMVLLRLVDERMLVLQREGRVSFYGACTGQEAATLASAAALEPEDWIFPALREAGAMLLRGFDLVTYLCQIFGNSGDELKGRQMPSHMASRRVNQVSWSSCIGSQLPQAVGAALAMKLRGDRKVAVAYVGDGGTASADFHAAMNFAGVLEPPLVVICQNNHWAISTPTARESGSATIAIKARAYGFPGLRVDGNDALAVYAATRAAAERARGGGGPTFLELETYRIGAHSTSDDPRVYRDEAEVEAWRRRDPLARLGAFLRARGLLDEAAAAAERAELEALVQRSIREAEGLPPPGAESLLEDVYARPPWQLAEQRGWLEPRRGH